MDKMIGIALSFKKRIFWKISSMFRIIHKEVSCKNFQLPMHFLYTENAWSRNQKWKASENSKVISIARAVTVAIFTTAVVKGLTTGHLAANSKFVYKFE